MIGAFPRSIFGCIGLYFGPYFGLKIQFADGVESDLIGGSSSEQDDLLILLIVVNGVIGSLFR